MTAELLLGLGLAWIAAAIAAAATLSCLFRGAAIGETRSTRRD